MRRRKNPPGLNGWQKVQAAGRKIITIQCTPEEYSAIKSAAKATYRTMSGFIRKAAIAAASGILSDG